MNFFRLRELLCLFPICAAALLFEIPQGHGETAASREEVIPISDALCADMIAHHVLNRDAPVRCERLRLAKFGYIGFDGQLHNDGEMVVLDAVADYALRIFAGLRKISFPLAKAKLMNAYDGNDDASMADNNTSAFNDRPITGGRTVSVHAFGLAIDVNPIQNPFVSRAGATLTFNPKSGIQYANRLNDRPWRKSRPGMAEAAVDVFADNGFLIWGGYWDSPIDYQHFQVNRGLANQLIQLPQAASHDLFAQHVDQYLKCRQAGSDRPSCVTAQDPAGPSDAD